jgi:hypothetical protein
MKNLGPLGTTASNPMELGDMADRLDEPLIARGYESRGDSRNDDGEHHDVEDLQRPGLFVWLLTFSAGISGLLFGCELSIPCDLDQFLPPDLTS